MVQKTFEDKEVALEKLFDNDYLFRMPEYQRPYSWTPEQAEELLNDLLGAMDDETTAEPYFLGSIVLIARPDSPVHEVIDGQQRLTTLTMLFCVLRELTDDFDSQSSLDYRVQERRDVHAGRRERFRLEIRERDQDFFHDNVQESGKIAGFVAKGMAAIHATDSRRLIFENAKFLYDRLSGRSVEERDKLATFLIMRCYLVVVSAYDRNSAHRIFSVLNARGRDLTPTDILKSDVIGEIPSRNVDRYNNLWEDTEDALGRDRFRELFAHIFVIETGNRFHRELAKAFKDNVLEKKVKGAQFVDERLIPYAEAFQVVTSATYASNVRAEDVNRMLNHLRELDNDDWIPAAMVFYDKHKADPETLLKLLTELDRLAYAMLIIGTRRDPRILRYREMLESALNGETGLEKTIAHLQLSDVERRRVVEALNEPIYRPRPVARYARPLLLRLDSVLAKASGAVYDHKIVTVEHVLPQSPNEESEWIQTFTEEDREYWTHRRANLVLLARGKNARAQNYEFDTKKDEYFLRGGVSNFALTTQVINETAWTPRVLERRQNALIDALKEEWRL